MLTSLQRRARADPWLRSGIKIGVSFSSVYRTIVTAGFGFRRTDMLSRWHELEGFDANRPILEKMYIDKPIPIVRHSAPEGDIGDAYRYRTETILRDPTTGEERTEAITVLSNQPLSFGDIKRDAQDVLMEYTEFQGWQIVETHLTEATIRGS